MKFHCSIDGVHFPQEFDDTLKAPCNFWGDIGMSNLDLDLKRKFWDWLFNCPTDEIGIRSQIGISIQFQTIPLDKEDMFKTKVVGYSDWNETQQQQFQKEYFKAFHAGANMEKWIKTFNIQREKLVVD